MLTPRQTAHSFLWAYRLMARTNYPAEVDFIMKYLTTDDICLDVGAHAGTWSYPLSKAAHCVYAFEAFPYYADVLGATMRLLNVNNVTVMNKAVSDHQGTVNLTWRASGKRLTGCTHVTGAGDQDAESINVTTIDLDSVVKSEGFEGRRVAFIKCDVEGYEYQVMSGAAQVIDKWRPLIFAEAKDSWFQRYGKTSADLINMLVSRGYSASVLQPHGQTQEVTASTYSGCGDILFCHPDGVC